MCCVSGAKPAAPRAAPKPRVGSARRPTGKSGGLGVKKMATKVDESLFDQAPEEAAPAPVVSLLLSLRLLLESSCLPIAMPKAILKHAI